MARYRLAPALPPCVKLHPKPRLLSHLHLHPPLLRPQLQQDRRKPQSRRRWHGYVLVINTSFRLCPFASLRVCRKEAIVIRLFFFSEFLVQTVSPAPTRVGLTSSQPAASTITITTPSSSTATSSSASTLTTSRLRVRELGVVIGRMTPGPFNAITDVPGV